MVLSAAYGVTFHLGRALHVLGVEVHIVFRVQIFAEGDTAATAVAYFTILDDPALAPVRSDETVLISCRRSPGGSSLINLKAAYGDVTHTGLVRHEAVTAYGDFYFLVVRVQSLEVSIENGCVAFLYGEPFVLGFFLIPCAWVSCAFDTLVESHGLVHCKIVQIYGTGVAYGRCEIPVTAYIGGVRIVSAEYTVVHAGSPYVAFIQGPVRQNFCTGDNSAERLFGTVYDAVVFRTCM